jgi:hypothetical protein
MIYSQSQLMKMIIAAAERWGVEIATNVTEGKTSELRTFTEYLVTEFVPCLENKGE